MKGSNAIVAGTGFDNRAGVIRRFCKPGSPVYLVREPDNTFDYNAIAVYIDARLWFFMRGRIQIGYIKAGTAERWAPRLDAGIRIRCWVESMHAPSGRDHPRVSIRIEPAE